MLRLLLAAVNRRRECDGVTIGAIVAELGDRSFGWSILLFSLFNLIPMPIGSNMITAIPLLLLTGQMALGFRYVRMPAFIDRREVSRNGFRRIVLRMKPIIRPIEKIIRPRYLWLFQPRAERMIGMLLLAVTFALFLPIPLSGFIPAAALFVASFGLVERDGLVTMIGMGIGILSIIITLVVGIAILLGAKALL